MNDNLTSNQPGGTAVKSERGFWPLIITQFQGAFSDNTLKWLAISIIMGMSLKQEQSDRLVGIVGGLFALPFIVFSMTGGFLADRFSKRTVTIGVKVFEIFVMLLALTGLAIHSIYVVIGAVFLMGVHSAIFGPSKYGLLPEILAEKKLSWGNGVMELTTFIAIIGGTVAGPWCYKAFAQSPAWAGVILIALAVVGLGTSFGIAKIPAANPAKPYRFNFVGDLWGQIQQVRQDRALWLAMLGNAYFFGMAALLQFVIVIYSKDTLHIDDATYTGYLQAATAIGIGLGSFAAGFLSGGKIEIGLIPFGAAGMTIFGILLGRSELSFSHVAWYLAALGFSGGFFIVPISALLQHLPAAERKGGVLAAANLLSFVTIFLASGIYYLFTSVLHLTAPQICLVVSAATLAATVYLLFLLPEALLRFFLLCLTHTFYRISIRGRDRIPAKGGALFVCNHVSFADALLLIASTDRPIRFLMFKDIYEKPLVRPFAKILRAIPVSSEQRPRELLHALETAREAVLAGEVVCIFAEGQITRIGQLLPFRRGFERIMKETNAPIIPVALDGVLGSPTSFERGRMVRRFPARIPHPVTVSFGAPMPATATPFEVREAVQALIGEAWELRRKHMLPLHRNFIRTARRHPRRFAMKDATSGAVTFGTALVKSVFLARRLRAGWRAETTVENQGMVGIFLPPGVPGALVNHAAFLCGQVPVNLNYTLSEATLAASVRQCGLQSVVTSRKFLEKLKLTPPGKLIYLEDLMAIKPTWSEKINAFVLAKFAPAWFLEWVLGQPRPVSLDDLATVIFSSGSTGEPKGVMLSQYNILSNIHQSEHILNFTHRDRFLGILPFFHSFGFTITLCLPAVLGAGVVYHLNPLDARGVGQLVRENNINLLLATPTFLQIYLRGVSPEDFGSLELVVAGAEKLNDRLAMAFEERFGVRPHEGYGTTECSPVVAVNMEGFRAAGFHQAGSKRGSIGRPLPGVTVRLVDPENPWNGRTVAQGEPGMLLVRGPNVMQGYLGMAKKSAEVLHDGWYCTGDMATMDEEGFLHITGRLSRFSKIGGEMVPHLRVEETLQEISQSAEQMFVVTATPDEKKGERLIVLHRLADADLATCLEQFAASELPNLWKPKADAFFRVESFPLLGTGKLDLRRVREMAGQLAAGQTGSASTPA